MMKSIIAFLQVIGARTAPQSKLEWAGDLAEEGWTTAAEAVEVQRLSEPASSAASQGISAPRAPIKVVVVQARQDMEEVVLDHTLEALEAEGPMEEGHLMEGEGHMEEGHLMEGAAEAKEVGVGVGPASNVAVKVTTPAIAQERGDLLYSPGYLTILIVLNLFISLMPMEFKSFKIKIRLGSQCIQICQNGLQ